MNRTIKLTYAGIVAAVAIVVALLLVPNYAGASSGLEPCVPKDAYTETVVVTPAIPAVPAVPGTPEIPGVPAVTETIHHEAVPPVTETIPAVPGLWLNWSPNHEQGPFIGPPAYPTDPRGTWQHWGDYKDIPGGHAGPDGVYQKGNGNGSWFYRQAPVPEKVIVITEGVDAYDEVIVITPAIPAVPATEGTPGSPAVPAVTKDIFHPAVVCTTPSETPTVTPPVVTETVVPPVVTETVVPTPTPDDVQTPEVTPIPEDNPVPVKVTTAFACVDGVWVTLVKKGDEVISKTESGSCVETSQNRKFVRAEETGL